MLFHLVQAFCFRVHKQSLRRLNIMNTIINWLAWARENKKLDLLVDKYAMHACKKWRSDLLNS